MGGEDIVCIGEFSECDGCEKTYSITQEEEAQGIKCEHEDGAVVPCEKGEGGTT